MIILFVAGILGIVFQLLAKFDSVKKDFKSATQEFSTKKFIEAEWQYIASSVVFVIILAVLVPELVALSPDVEKYLRIVFVLGGAIGAWGFSYFLGKSKKYIRSKIDEKTKVYE